MKMIFTAVQSTSFAITQNAVCHVQIVAVMITHVLTVWSKPFLSYIVINADRLRNCEKI